MENQLTIGSLIKRHIKMRGKTTKQVAKALGRNYTTFCGILNRNAVDAELLFELANYWDIDLIWMSQLFDHRKAISSLERYQMPRMNSDFRKHEYGDACVIMAVGVLVACSVLAVVLKKKKSWFRIKNAQKNCKKIVNYIFWLVLK